MCHLFTSAGATESQLKCLAIVLLHYTPLKMTSEVQCVGYLSSLKGRFNELVYRQAEIGFLLLFWWHMV